MTPKYACMRWDFHFLVYVEERRIHAHCLETDTVADGDTFEKAVQNLQDAVELQIADCRKKGSFDGLWNSAPKEYWDAAKKYAFRVSYYEARKRPDVSPKSEAILEKTAQHLYKIASSSR